MTAAAGPTWSGTPRPATLLTPAMRRRAAAGDLGSHPDVYGRLWWDRPAVTIKRECGHIGNGRYAHPEQDRLCTVREMAILQGFPRGYRFAGSLSNMYRHIGDAVPPLISYQLAAACRWMLTGAAARAGRPAAAGRPSVRGRHRAGRPSSRVPRLTWDNWPYGGISTGQRRRAGARPATPGRRVR